jgi:hypothetical protein
MNGFLSCRSLALFALVSLVIPVRAHAQVTFSSSGANAAAIQTTVDAFRTSLGPLNPNVAGSFGSGRREINWDGVPAAFSAPNLLTANFFNSNSPRGVVFSTPGTGFEVSGATTDAGAGQPAAANFGNIDASYTATFATFSAQRLFTAVGSNIVDVSFFIAGSATPALSAGFGAVFSDVDLANTTSLQFFDASNVSLGTFFAPAVAGANQTFSFLGVQFASAVISRVRITNGNIAPASGNTDQNGVARDVVVMDDFIFAEPIPEPGTIVLLSSGVLLLAAFARRRRS